MIIKLTPKEKYNLIDGEELKIIADSAARTLYDSVKVEVDGDLDIEACRLYTMLFTDKECVHPLRLADICNIIDNKCASVATAAYIKKYGDMPERSLIPRDMLDIEVVSCIPCKSDLFHEIGTHAVCFIDFETQYPTVIYLSLR